MTQIDWDNGHVGATHFLPAKNDMHSDVFILMDGMTVKKVGYPSCDNWAHTYTALTFLRSATCACFNGVKAIINAAARSARRGIVENDMSNNESEMRFVFTEMPGPGNGCVFVEVEDSNGASINAGEWRKRDDGLVELVVLSTAIGYTAVNMTTAAAEGFRDGQSSVVVEMPSHFIVPAGVTLDAAGVNAILRAITKAIIAAGGTVKE